MINYQYSLTDFAKCLRALIVNKMYMALIENLTHSSRLPRQLLTLFETIGKIRPLLGQIGHNRPINVLKKLCQSDLELAGLVFIDKANQREYFLWVHCIKG